MTIDGTRPDGVALTWRPFLIWRGKAVDRLDQTLRAGDPERARAALVDVLPPSGITLTPDKTR
jgi:hypothetical protein